MDAKPYGSDPPEQRRYKFTTLTLSLKLNLISTNHNCTYIRLSESVKRFSDYIRITLQKCNIQLSDLEASARYRDVWRTVCETGLNSFMNDCINTSMKRRAARHASTAKPKTCPRCPHCGRLCTSDFGLYAAIFVSTHLLDRTILSSATSSSSRRSRRTSAASESYYAC